MSAPRGTQPPLLNICVLAACPFPANHGSPGSIREFSEALSRRGHNVHIVTYPFGENIDIRGVRIHRVGNLFQEKRIVVGPTWRKPFYDLMMVFKAIKVCWKHDIDIVHAHLYEAALVAWLTRLFTLRRFVYSGHNTMIDELASYDFFRSKRIANGLARFLDWFVPRRADRCIPHSERIKKFFHQQGLASKCEPIVHFGIDLSEVERQIEEFPAKDSSPAERPSIVYTGVFDHFQRLDILLDAISIVRCSHPNVLLTLCMTLDQQEFADELYARAQASGLAESIEITPRLSFDECLRAIDKADIAICPRPSTPGVPIKLLNYWALKKAVVMFASSASEIKHKHHAWLAKEDTAEELAAGVVALLKDHALRQELGVHGKQYLSQNHDRSAIAGQLIACFVGVLKGTRRWNVICPREKEQQENEHKLLGAGLRS